MHLNFEQQKNIKATTYTLVICVLLSLLFFVLRWEQPQATILAPVPSLMEVNLGNATTGEGNIAPLDPNAPAPTVGKRSNNIPSTVRSTVKLNANSNDPNDERIQTSKGINTKKNNPLPIAAKPKALMGKYAGGNGQGGNNQDSYNNVKSQGITSGNGDQGVENGSITGNTYNGSAGPFVTKGNRKITKAYSFNGDVEPATIYAEIEVSPSGAGRFIQIVRGSSSNDRKYKKAIVEYLNKIAFTTSDRSSVVTVKFKFEVQ